MTYDEGHPVRQFGGRLALDFVNTADWLEDGQILHERVLSPADQKIWMNAVGLGAARPLRDIGHFHDLRASVRRLLLGSGSPGDFGGISKLELARTESTAAPETAQPLDALIAISTLSILMDDRERRRVRLCPGPKCGWLFIDETKNARRRWCSMETCGNRAKAARHYARAGREAGSTP